MPGRASGVKMVRMAEMAASISLDGVAVHQDCWCVCLCYLHFAPENEIQKMAKCTFWYQLTRVVPDKVQRAVKWLFVYMCLSELVLMYWYFVAMS